jgi:hypothetical protein
MVKNSAEYMRQYKKDHPERKAKERKRYKKAHPEKVKEARKRNRKLHPKNKGDAVAQHKRYTAKLRYEIINYYSDGMLECANCEEDHMEFLEIDHIHGGGNQHKKEIGKSLYKWLKDNGFPAGFQVLCSNCNWKKVKMEAEARGINGTYEQRKYYRRQQRLKLDVFAHYTTDGKIKCSCCGIEDIDVLCMDHINGDGAEHRRTIGPSYAKKTYQWIKLNNYPPGFRILCSNCNQCLGNHGYCPHHTALVPSSINLPMVPI